MWLSHPNLKNKLKEWWTIDIQDTKMFQISTKLKDINFKLKEWNKTVFQDISRRKAAIRKDLDSLESNQQN